MASRISRLAALALAVAALAATATPAPAGAQAPPGVGSTTGSTTLLGIRIGEPAVGPLDVRLLGEDGTSLLDSLEGTPNAMARVVPLSVTSSLVPALSAVNNLVPTVESRSTGAEDARSTVLLDLDALSTSLGVPGLLGGAIQPAHLTTAVEAAGARSLVDSAVTGVTAFGGVVGLDTLTLAQSSLAAPGSSNAQRGVTLASLDVLTLDGLLGFLGITLEDLPLDAALGLLDSLGLTVDGLDGAALGALVNTVLGNITALTTAIENAACDLNLPLVGEILDCAAAQGALTTMVTQLGDLVTGIIDTLTGTPLLSLDGIELDVVARAGATVADSVADVVSSIGAIRVAGIALPGVDVASTLEQIEAIVDQITAQLDTVLGGVLPSLAGLLDIDILDEATSVVQTATGIEARSAATGLRIVLTPPDLCVLLRDLGGVGSLGDLLGGPSGALAPVGEILSGLRQTVNCPGAAAAGDDAAAAGLVDGVAAALTEPLTIEALSVSEASVLRLPAAPVTPTPVPDPAPPSLARTGTGSTVPLVLAATMLGASLLVRRRLVPVRVKG